MYKSTKPYRLNCEIVTKTNKMYKKYNKPLAKLDKM